MSIPKPTKEKPDADANHAPEILERLVRQAERAGASDIHLQMRGPAAEVAFRLDGVIAPVSGLPAEVAERVFGRIKFLARLKTYQESLAQDGRHASAPGFGAGVVQFGDKCARRPHLRVPIDSAIR